MKQLFSQSKRNKNSQPLSPFILQLLAVACVVPQEKTADEEETSPSGSNPMNDSDLNRPLRR